MNKEVLLSNIDKVHTTELGIGRIKKNLNLDNIDIVEYCKNKVYYIYHIGGTYVKAFNCILFANGKMKMKE